MKVLNKLAIVIMIVTGLSFVNKTMAQESELKPMAEFDKTTHDFGQVPQGIPVKAIFKVKNTSMVPLVITNVKPTCGCTVADYPREPIKPGETGEIAATYNARSVGPFTKTVHVYTNTNEGLVDIYMKGEVVASQPAYN